MALGDFGVRHSKGIEPMTDGMVGRTRNIGRVLARTICSHPYLHPAFLAYASLLSGVSSLYLGD